MKTRVSGDHKQLKMFIFKALEEKQTWFKLGFLSFTYANYHEINQTETT